MPREDFREVALVVDPQDKVVIAPVTVRETSDGLKFSFALLREFTKGTGEARTCWFFRRHIPGLRRTLDEIENFFEAEERKKKKL